jgi:hypothetical protein
MNVHAEGIADGVPPGVVPTVEGGGDRHRINVPVSNPSYQSCV